MAGFDNDIMYAKNADFTQADNQAVSESNGLVTNGQLWVGSTATNAGGTHINVGNIVSPLGTLSIGYSSPNITADLIGGVPDLHTAKYIVSSETNVGGNYTNITAAIAAAQGSGIKSTIFIMPGLTGNYTENFTLPANINLAAYSCDSLTPNVTIIGKITCTDAGSRSITGIRLQTNSDYLLELTGSSATIVNMFNCYLNCPNFSGIHSTNSNGASGINVLNTKGDLGTTGIGIHINAGSTFINYNFCNLTNSGSSLSASTTTGNLSIQNSTLLFALSSSSTAAVGIQNSIIDVNALNITAATLNGTGGGHLLNSEFASGTASAVSIGAGVIYYVDNIHVASSNTNIITGAGTINYGYIGNEYNSGAINTSTVVPTRSFIGNIYGKSISFDAGSNVLSALPVPIAQGGTGNTNFAGNKVLIQSQTASNSASLVFTSGITGYSYYYLEMTAAILQTNAQNINLQFSLDGGATYETTQYVQSGPFTVAAVAGALSYAAGVNPGFAFGFASDNSTTIPITGYCNLYNLNSSSLYKQVIITSINANAGSQGFQTSGGNFASITAVNALKIIPGSGNLVSGTFRLFGVI